MTHRESCIASQFSHYGELSDGDMEILAELEKEPLRVSAGTTLWKEGDETGDLYAISQGWAISYRDMNDGTRQVLDVYLPGDVIGLADFSFACRLANVNMLTSGVVCRLSMDRLSNMFKSSSRLGSTLLSISARNQTLLTERLVNLGRRTAREKLSHFIFEMYVRLKRIDRSIGNQFELPLSQQVLADILGLSAVHISRTFSDLREEGLIYRHRNRIELPDPERISQVARFSANSMSDGMRRLYY